MTQLRHTADARRVMKYCCVPKLMTLHKAALLGIYRPLIMPETDCWTDFSRHAQYGMIDSDWSRTGSHDEYRVPRLAGCCAADGYGSAEVMYWWTHSPNTSIKISSDMTLSQFDLIRFPHGNETRFQPHRGELSSLRKSLNWKLLQICKVRFFGDYLVLLY